MKGLTPEFVLNTRDVQRHDALCTMLENYGFKIRSTKSSHFLARHTDDRCSDIICGLVIGTKDVVYQRIAAKACLEAKERLERMTNAQSQAEHDLPPEEQFQEQKLPDHLQVTRQKNQIIVRLKDMPEIGLLYPLDRQDDLVEAAKLAGEILEEQKKPYKEKLDQICADYCIKQSRENKTNRLILSSPLLWMGSYVVNVYSPASDITPLTALEHVNNYLSVTKEIFNRTKQAIKDAPYVSNWNVEENDDSPKRISFKMHNKVRGINGNVSFTNEPYDSMSAATFVILMDNLVSFLFPQDLERTLGAKYGITLSPQKNGSLLLRQRFFGLEREIPDFRNSLKIQDEAEKRMAAALAKGRADFLQVYQDIIEQVEDLSDVYDDIEAIASEVTTRIQEEKIHEKYNQCVQDLIKNGFNGKSLKQAKLGYITDIRFTHPQSHVTFTINMQILRGENDENIYLVSDRDLQKMRDAADKAREFAKISPCSSPFTVSPRNAFGTRGAGAPRQTDPLGAAISGMVGFNRSPR
jgi:hypothetical protein